MTTKYRKVSVEQIYTLIEYLEKNPVLTRRMRSSEGLLITAKLWGQIARKVNGVGGGCIKTPRGWQKYLADYKCRVLSRMRQRRKFGESNNDKLTPMEKRLLEAISKHQRPSGAVSVDPLNEEGIDFNIAGSPSSPSSPDWPDEAAGPDLERSASSQEMESLAMRVLNRQAASTERMTAALMRLTGALDMLTNT